MTVVTFDTHRAVKRLTGAGLSETVAETVTDVLRESREADLSQLATKADLDAVRAEIAALRREMQGEIATVRQEIEAGNTALRQEMEVGNAALRREMEVGNAALRRDMQDFVTKAELAELKADLFKWLITLLLGQAALITALVKLL